MTRRKKMTVRKLRDLPSGLMDQYPNDSIRAGRRSSSQVLASHANLSLSTALHR
jgi:hypothetical protein